MEDPGNVGGQEVIRAVEGLVARMAANQVDGLKVVDLGRDSWTVMSLAGNLNIRRRHQGHLSQRRLIAEGRLYLPAQGPGHTPIDTFTTSDPGHAMAKLLDDMPRLRHLIARRVAEGFGVGT